MGSATEEKLSELRDITSTNNLAALRKATSKLQEFSDMIEPDSRCISEVIQLKLEKGTCLIFGLYKTDDVAISRAFLSAGSISNRHDHNEKEIMGVISGKLLIDAGGDAERYVNQYEIIELLPNTPHAVMALEDTWLWAVTMPSSKEFPDGPKQ